MVEGSREQRQPLHSVVRPSQELLQRWIQKHADLLAKERQVEQEEARLLLSNCPPKQLERHGLAILGLGVLSVSVGLGGKTLVELERPAAYHSSPTLPPHTLRPGDLVQVEEHAGDSSSSGSSKNATKTSRKADSSTNAQKPVSAVVFRVTDTKIIVAASQSKGDASELEELPSRLRVVKLANETTFDRMEWNLTKLAKVLRVSVKTAKRSHDASSSDEEELDETEGVATGQSHSTTQNAPSTLVSALIGATAPAWHAWPAGEDDQMRLFNESLNPSQVDAVKFALSAEHFALIHGPPGTGKTTAVAEMVLQMAIVRQKRVLVCGASNLAADNLLERIIVKGGDALKRSHIGITRIGHPARVLPSIVPSTLDYQAQHSSEGALVKDVKAELEAALASLRPKDSTAAGNKSTSARGQAPSKAQRLRGSERKERRDEIKALRKEFRKRSRGLVNAVLQRASIVVSTCHGAGGKQLNGLDFDVVVIDEACQATEASCWIPVLKAKADGKLILAGDHLQLPPTVKSYRHSQHRRKRSVLATSAPLKDDDGDANGKEAKDEMEEEEDENQEQYEAPKRPRKTTLRPPQSLETTLFSRLLGMYGQGCKALLDTQYRMNEEIMAFPNEALYQGKIKADKSCAKIRLSDLEEYRIGQSDRGEDPREKGEFEVETMNAPIVFYDTAGCEVYETQQQAFNDQESGKASLFQLDSKANSHEVELVVQHVRALVANGLSPERISILSPYNLQVSALADRLRDVKVDKQSSLNSNKSRGGGKLAIQTLDRIAVGSIDSMQGMENDVVILSLVRSNEQREVGFLAEQRRLNVAMTRAKRQLCIVGDSETIGEAGDVYLKHWMSFLDENASIEPVIV